MKKSSEILSGKIVTETLSNPADIKIDTPVILFDNMMAHVREISGSQYFVRHEGKDMNSIYSLKDFKALFVETILIEKAPVSVTNPKTDNTLTGSGLREIKNTYPLVVDSWADAVNFGIVNKDKISKFMLVDSCGVKQVELITSSVEKESYTKEEMFEELYSFYKHDKEIPRKTRRDERHFQDYMLRTYGVNFELDK